MLIAGNIALIAKDAKLPLEQKTGKKVITNENYLPPKIDKMKLDK